MIRWNTRLFLCLLGLIWLQSPAQALACASCFGQSDSALAVGMNWGIFSLLTVVIFVLSGFAAFFIYLAKRAAIVGDGNDPAPAAESKEKV